MSHFKSNDQLVIRILLLSVAALLLIAANLKEPLTIKDSSDAPDYTSSPARLNVDSLSTPTIRLVLEDSYGTFTISQIISSTTLSLSSLTTGSVILDTDEGSSGALKVYLSAPGGGSAKWLVFNPDSWE